VEKEWQKAQQKREIPITCRSRPIFPGVELGDWILKSGFQRLVAADCGQRPDELSMPERSATLAHGALKVRFHCLALGAADVMRMPYQ